MFFKRIGKIAIMAVAFFCYAMTASVHADPLDMYREMILSKSYTIKYENITPETRSTNRNKVTMTGKGMGSDMASALYQPTENIVVCDGENRYEESGYGEIAQCNLQRGDEVYRFSRVKTNGGITYVGNYGKMGEVTADKVNKQNALLAGMSFGDYQMSRFLNAILPNDIKVEGSVLYNRVASGTLGNGISYIDYKSDGNGFLEAIRYYFQGNKLIKISSGQYYTNDKGELDGIRYIIKINEFSSVPDRTYLSLPNGLVDKTQRK